MLRLLLGISSLLISTLPAHSPTFSQNLSRVFPVLAVPITGSCVGPQTKVGHPAHRYRRLMYVPLLNANSFKNICYCFFLGLRSEIVDITLCMFPC